MADNELKTVFSYEENEASRKKITKGIEDLERAQKQAALAAAKGEVQYASAAKVIDKLGKEKADLVKISKQLSPEFTKEAKALSDVRNEAEKAALSFGELADKRRQALDAAGTGFSGDVASSVGGLRGAADALTGGNAGGLGKGLEAVEGLADIGEFLPLLAGQMKTVFDAAKSGTGIIGGLATGFTALVPALGATGGAIAAVALPAAAFAAVLTPLVIGFQKAQKQSEEYVAALGREADVRQAARDASRDADAALAAGDTQRLVDERQAIADQLAQESRAFTEENALLLEQNAAIREAGLFELPRGARAARDEQKKLVEDMGQNITTLTTQLAEYDERLAGVSEEEINRALNIENLSAVESEVAATEAERTNTLNQLQAAQSRVEALDAQRASMIEARAQQDVFASQTAALESKFANEDQAAQNRELYAELDSIASDGKDKLAAIETELSDLRIDRAAAIVDIEAKGAQKVSKLNQDYFSKTLADTKKFGKETQRLEEDNKRARLKLIADITERLDSAARDNNVIAFLEAQRDGQKQLKEQAETDTEAAKRRVADFNTAQEEARVAQQERLAETVAAIAEEKAQALAAFEEKRLALVAQKDAEKAAILEAQQAAVARYTETEANEAQAADRQRQREELREQQQDIVFQQSLDQIEQKKQAELAAVNTIIGTVDVLTQKVNALKAQANQITTQSAVKAASFSTNTNSSTNSGGGPFGLFSAINNSIGFGQKIKLGGGVGAFAEGGIVNKPTLALIGEAGYPEAVVPMKPSQGLPASFGRNSATGGGTPINVTVQMPVTVGDVATASMVTRQIENAVTIVLRDGIAPIITQALYPKAG